MLFGFDKVKVFPTYLHFRRAISSQNREPLPILFPGAVALDSQVDASTGAKQVFLYRDAHGVPSGAALVGLVSVEAALRMQVRPHSRPP